MIKSLLTILLACFVSSVAIAEKSPEKAFVDSARGVKILKLADSSAQQESDSLEAVVAASAKHVVTKPAKQTKTPEKLPIQKLLDESKTSESSVFSSPIFRVSAMLEIIVAVFVVIYFRRRKINKLKESKVLLKKNINNLRKEKTGKFENEKLNSLRAKLALQEDKNYKNFTKQARKYEISTGELQLLSRLRILANS